MKKVVVTGAGGFLGWHIRAKLYSENISRVVAGSPKKFEVVCLSRADFASDTKLGETISNAHTVIHCAGVNRIDTDGAYEDNIVIAKRLAESISSLNADAHVIFSNSVHSLGSTPYGVSKFRASEILSDNCLKFTDIRLPHLFGEYARPQYNNVTSTFIDNVINEQNPVINKDGIVNLLNVSDAVNTITECMEKNIYGTVTPVGREITVADLFQKILNIHITYESNIFPNFSCKFNRDIFNCYLTSMPVERRIHKLKEYCDERGKLFEAVKSSSTSQVFISHTKPGVIRGNHFHLKKIERFLVLQGNALIRTRKLFTGEVMELQVCGAEPTAVDIPVLNTHSIENIGSDPLITLFWSDAFYNADNPDTFLEPV